MQGWHVTYFAANGNRVTSGSLTIPYYGAWTADLMLAEPDALSSPVTVTIGPLSLTGAVVRSAPFAGARQARLVAGAGGWRKSLVSRSYQFGAGVKLSTVLGDAATELGEKINLPTDVVLGAAWTRPTQTGGQLLRQLAAQWWIDNAGVTQFASSRPSTTVSSAFVVVSDETGLGEYDIATEAPQDWAPGATFSAPTIAGNPMISSVTYRVDNDGLLRVRVLSTGEAIS